MVDYCSMNTVIAAVLFEITKDRKAPKTQTE